MALSDKINDVKDGWAFTGRINVEDVKDSIKELKRIGLKKTPYPKYLLLTIDDLKKVFGDALCVEDVE